MEGRRLSIHAGAPRRQEVKLGLAALLAIVLASPLAGAVPKDGKARAAFDQGIAAYQKSDWAAAAATGTDPASDEAQVLAARHVAWLTSIPGTPGHGTGAPVEYVLGLAELYVADERFGATYGGPQGAAFVREALHAWAASR